VKKPQARYSALSALWKELKTDRNQTHLGIIDVGAGNGLSKHLQVFQKFAHFHFFEPDHDALLGLEKELQNTNIASFSIHNFALGRDLKADQEFFITLSGQNSSCLRPNKSFARRYRISGFEVVKKRFVDTRNLDSLSFEHPISLIKVDAQGFDLEILHGGDKLISEHVSVAIIESCFTTMYHQQPLFCDIQSFFEKRGFSFYGFLNTNSYSTKSVNQRKVFSRERFVWADAVFVKDPIESNAGTFSSDCLIDLVFCLLGLEFNDLAIEITERFLPSRLDEVSRYLESFAFEDFDTERDALICLISNLDSENFAQRIMEYVDKYSGYGNPAYLKER